MANPIISKISWEKNKVKGWTTLSLVGSMDINTSPKIDAEGQKMLKETEKLAVDLSGIKYISSAGLRVLMRMAKIAKKECKEFVLAGAVEMVATVLKESKMDMIVAVINSLDDLE